MTDRGATALRSSPRFRSSPRPSLHRQHFNRQTTRAVARTPGGTRRASGGIQKPPGEPLRRSNRAKPVNPDLAAAQAAAEHARVARARAQARSNPSNPRISEEEDSGEEEDSDDEKKEGEQNSLPSPTIDDAAPRKFQFSLLGQLLLMQFFTVPHPRTTTSDGSRGEKVCFGSLLKKL